MALHQRTHPVPVDGCFGCKVIGLNFATVPGAYRDSVSNARVDMDSIQEQLTDSDGNPLFSEERVRDTQSDVMAKIRDFNEAADG